jgi:hypothetical protein
MARTLALLVALLSLTTAASSETPPGPPAAAQATLFTPAQIATDGTPNDPTRRIRSHAVPIAMQQIRPIARR